MKVLIGDNRQEKLSYPRLTTWAGATIPKPGGKEQLTKALCQSKPWKSFALARAVVRGGGSHYENPRLK